MINRGDNICDKECAKCAQEHGLNNVPTCTLVHELETREGVEQIWVNPYSPYRITTEEKTVSDDGPATLLIIID